MSNYAIVQDNADRFVLTLKRSTRVFTALAGGFGGWIVWWMWTQPEALATWIRVTFGLLGAAGCIGGLGSAFNGRSIEVDRSRRRLSVGGGLLGRIGEPGTVPFQDIESLELSVYKKTRSSHTHEYSLLVKTKAQRVARIHLDVSRNAAYVNRVLGRLSALIGCPVMRGGVPQEPPYAKSEDSA